MKEDVKEDIKKNVKLGMAYLTGKGVEKDEKKGFAYILNAAERGYAPAQCLVGVKFLMGEIVKKDEEKALEWCLAAAKQNHTHAHFVIGFIYESGDFSRRSWVKAIEWYSLGAKLGDIEACKKVANCAKEGRKGIPNINVLSETLVRALTTYKPSLSEPSVFKNIANDFLSYLKKQGRTAFTALDQLFKAKPVLEAGIKEAAKHNPDIKELSDCITGPSRDWRSKINSKINNEKTPLL